MWRVLLLVAIMGVPAPAAAQFLTGNELYLDLQAYKRIVEGSPVNDRTRISLNTMHAFGYLKGVADATNGDVYCLPTKITGLQLIDITLQYLQTYPERRHLGAAELIMATLAEKFPCPKTGSSK